MTWGTLAPWLSRHGGTIHSQARIVPPCIQRRNGDPTCPQGASRISVSTLVAEPAPPPAHASHCATPHSLVRHSQHPHSLPRTPLLDTRARDSLPGCAPFLQGHTPPYDPVSSGVTHAHHPTFFTPVCFYPYTCFPDPSGQGAPLYTDVTPSHPHTHSTQSQQQQQQQ